jgi:hypothetical protein
MVLDAPPRNTPPWSWFVAGCKQFVGLLRAVLRKKTRTWMMRSGVRPGWNDIVLLPSSHKVGVESWTSLTPRVCGLYSAAKVGVSMAKVGASVAKVGVSMAKRKLVCKLESMVMRYA